MRMHKDVYPTRGSDHLKLAENKLEDMFLFSGVSVCKATVGSSSLGPSDQQHRVVDSRASSGATLLRLVLSTSFAFKTPCVPLVMA